MICNQWVARYLLPRQRATDRLLVMDAHVEAPSAVVEREIELDLTPAELWAAVCDPTSWLADEGSLAIVPGGEGRLVDDGVARRALVEEVEPGRRLVFRWWDEHGDRSDESRVELTVLSAPISSVLTIRETRPATTPRATASTVAASTSLRWELRLTCLAFVFALVPALARV
jgi:uncharacterized protein YndB with AHSA1/START domain